MKYGVFLILLLFTIKASAQSQQKREHITVDGIIREFMVYTPAVSSPDKLPVLISLHGRFGTGDGMMKFADFRPIADREKFIIVCPDGIDRSWNDGRETPAHKKGINDVKFIDQLITYILNTNHANDQRIYIAGMSNGGFMTSRLACELSNRIAAIAVVSASVDKGMDYHPVKPLPVMYIQGTKDPLVPYNGGSMKGAGGEIYSHTDILKLWAQTAGCQDNLDLTNLPDSLNDGTSIKKERYSNSTTGIKVVGYTVADGGHTWPGGTQYLPKFIVGTASHNINACEVIWAFFKSCKLRG
ncbi:alpha/beta hydrolase family esterase [Mucilaginibacter sp. X4EP1]|uniref:alpha/beta hydrolase family esterase n=1 Tax=Mucilaginibacter sp. X4EP1 TaxID=2723092 RepID=UPI002168D115|nr:PHB depolymerase family esterase [Mucilaginibacter sp. X4EP1]MCS3816293.1 polyhydroxybutyrate depolymerase [Mucilaginibacter sp. X4EP1]